MSKLLRYVITFGLLKDKEEENFYNDLFKTLENIPFDTVEVGGNNIKAG